MRKNLTNMNEIIHDRVPLGSNWKKRIDEDYIILSMNIEAKSETYDLAMSEAAERIKKLQGAAVRVGYCKEDLKTTSFNVRTRYENAKDWRGNYKQEFAEYAWAVTQYRL